MKAGLKAHCMLAETKFQKMMQHQGIVPALTQKMPHRLLNHSLILKRPNMLWSSVGSNQEAFRQVEKDHSTTNIIGDPEAGV